MAGSDHSKSLDERIARIEAVEAIKVLKYRYFRACDAKDPKGFRAAFIDKGAIIDYGVMGSFDDADGIAAVFENIALRKVDGKHLILDMHHGIHPDIRITGDGAAEGNWTLRFRQINLHDMTEKVAAVEYADEYVVENGQWKISKCVSTELWSIGQPLPAGFTITDNLVQ